MLLKRRLGDVLKAKKSVTEADLLRLMEQAPPRTRLGDLILDRGLVSKEELVLALQEVVGCHYLDARFVTVEPAALRMLPKTSALRFCALPMALVERQLVVVLADPQDLRVLDELRFVSGMAISPRLGLRTEILSAIERCYDQADQQSESTENTGSTARLTIPFIDQTETGEIQFLAANSGERARATMEEFAAE